MKAKKLIINGEEQLLFDWDYNSLSNQPVLWTAASKDVGTSVGEIPVVGSNWKIDSSIVPTVISDIYTVTNASDLTSLSNAVKWDYWIVTSESKTYILSADPYSVLSNWVEMLSPTSSVSSVNTKTWAVTLTTSDIAVGDTSHQYVTSNEKNTWNNKLGVNDVATVATTGNYNDLNNKPSLTNNAYLTQAQYDALPSSKLTDWNSYFIYTS